MATLIHRILDEMSKVDLKSVKKRFEKDPVRPNERVVGKASDDLLRIYGLFDQEVKKFNTSMSEGSRRFGVAGIRSREAMAELRVFLERAREMESRLELLKGFFWASVNEEFPETRQNSCGIRKDGQIVCWDDEERLNDVRVELLKLLTGFRN